MAARYDTDAAQSIDNASYEIVNFDSTTFGYDSHGAVTTGASWKFTASSAGKYDTCGTVSFNFGAGVLDEGETIEIALYKNGTKTAVLAGFDSIASPSSAIEYTLSGCTTIDLSKDDYIDIRAYQNTGAGVALVTEEEKNYISITRQGF